MERRTVRLKKEMDAAKKKARIKTMAITGVAGVVAQLGFANATVEASSVRQNFIQSIAEPARQLAAQNDLYASVMIAQAILESNWGTSGLSLAPNYNLFGVKGSYNGQSVNMWTLEDTGKGNLIKIKDNFRKYPSYYHSLSDYVGKLRNGLTNSPYFYAGTWKSRTNSYKDATAYLTGRYATDTTYASKLNRLIEQYNLTQYDTPSTGKSTTTVTTPVNTTVTASSSQTTVANGQYVVKAGDSLYRIAVNNNMTLAQLKSLNNLTGDLIHPGQTLRVSGQVSGTVQVNNSNTTTATVQSNVTEKNSTNTTGTYTVKAGDSVYRISKNHGISMDTLKALNGLQSNLIHPGQVLKVSGTPTTTASSQPTAVKGQHVVKQGDTLYRIALNNGTTVSELMRKNNLTSALIKVDQVLYI